MDNPDLLNRFKYHPPTPYNMTSHELVRAQCLFLADKLNKYLPEGREKSLAMTKLEEVMFWGNAAIARNNNYG